MNILNGFLMPTISFDDVARLPSEDDNIAIATCLLPAGTQITYHNKNVILSHTVILGHRFAIQPLSEGEALRSWGQTFGAATKAISVGDYVCNADVLQELSRRSLEIDLPSEANFQNELEPYQFDEGVFQPATVLPYYSGTKTFMGYRRTGKRGVGTRNTIILLGVSSLTSGFVRKLESRLKEKAAGYVNIDGILPVAHTEGGHGKSNNQEMLLRTLAGFVVHPNVAAVLLVDYGQETINNALLQDYMEQNDYPLENVLHHFMSLSDNFDADLRKAEELITGWLDTVNHIQRTAQPLSELKIALQCGGSDAFSGISGNPLAAWVAKEIIQYGGAANLAETDELIGAESYVLDKVRDAATAKKFLAVVERFKERVALHGHSADGNPSGGNKFRGLYNIYLKSLGAATKRHPDVRLDYVIDYSEPMQQSGFYFMDSPGNDLESIAGQVASGCNMIFFVTGNGSITNFPFVPTIKIVTTTERYSHLADDMDINAGAYLDGTPLDELGAETLQYTIDIASGQLSVGERAGHSQVQIWRDWQQTQIINIESLKVTEYNGKPIPINSDGNFPNTSIPLYRNGKHYSSEQVGLIMPTSLCSGQIARLCVDTLNKHPMLENSSISRFVTLVHTEGCGASFNVEFHNTLLGYLSHPSVRHALLLEHGCEATHNDFFRHAMKTRGYNPQDYGWASIQLDGGIQNVIQKMIDWFEQQIARDSIPEKVDVGLEALNIALVSNTELSPQSAQAFAHLTQMIVAAGGTVIINEQDTLLKSNYVKHLAIEDNSYPSLGYAQVCNEAGFHIMTMPTRDWGEILTGLGAAGVGLIVSFVDTQPMPGHPMIPVLQAGETHHSATDIFLQATGQERTDQMFQGIVDTLAQYYIPKVVQSGNAYFQVTRGLLGVSL